MEICNNLNRCCFQDTSIISLVIYLIFHFCNNLIKWSVSFTNIFAQFKSNLLTYNSFHTKQWPFSNISKYFHQWSGFPLLLIRLHLFRSICFSSQDYSNHLQDIIATFEICTDWKVEWKKGFSNLANRKPYCWYWDENTNIL